MVVRTEYILSESEFEEYMDLVYKASIYERLKSEHQKLKRDYAELDSKYTKLLVFGVSVANDRLKCIVK